MGWSRCWVVLLSVFLYRTCSRVWVLLKCGSITAHQISLCTLRLQNTDLRHNLNPYVQLFMQVERCSGLPTSAQRTTIPWKQLTEGFPQETLWQYHITVLPWTFTSEKKEKKKSGFPISICSAPEMPSPLWQGFVATNAVISLAGPSPDTPPTLVLLWWFHSSWLHCPVSRH